jgi:hypothetical protein
MDIPEQSGLSVERVLPNGGIFAADIGPNKTDCGANGQAAVHPLKTNKSEKNSPSSH